MTSYASYKVSYLISPTLSAPLPPVHPIFIRCFQSLGNKIHFLQVIGYFLIRL